MKKEYNIEDLCQRFKQKDKIALARLITLVENNPNSAEEIFTHLNNTSNESYIIGVTGSPGVGKSTLTGKLTEKIIEEGKSVGIISIDPSSPFSGGAFLGDRVRMKEITIHPNVFMRSLASRGYKGGVSRAVFDISLLYEAYGMDVILIETVGVGQSEFDIYNLAYTVVVMLAPNMGDAIQMQKAGIIETADIYDVNKKDLGGEDLVVQIEMMLDDATSSQSGWRPPVVMTNSASGEGIDILLEKIWDHKEYLELSELIKTRKTQRYIYKIKASMIDRIESILLKNLFNNEELDDLASNLLDNQFDIYRNLEEMFNKVHFSLKKDA
ncbi:MAG: putative GTPase [Promethearchaeota archaeon]|nr:MAG: putative GTPase [Candidatus Lokiarchaeota archaeon]